MKKTTLNDVLKVINQWSKNNDVMFFGGFCSFDKAGDVTDESRMVAFGTKEVIKISLEEFTKEFNKEKKKFVNW